MRSKSVCLSAVVIILCGCTGPVLSATFDLVAVHPEVATQTTFYGDHIATLKPFNGRLYAGYGDYGSNTGPIAVRAYDPTLGGFTDSMLTSATEAIYIYREIDGRLYAPNIDTRGGGSGYAVGNPGIDGALDSWTDQITVDGVHMFDMNTFNGSDLFLGGTAGNGDGIVYRSTDSGATWQESLRMPAGVGAPNNETYADIRVHGLGLYQGKLYADMEQIGVFSGGGIYYTSGKKALPSMVFDGTAWTTGPTLTTSGYMAHPEEFAGKLIYLTDGLFASKLYGYNGKRVAQAYNAKGKNAGSDFIYDYTIVDGALYALTADNRVITTTDLATWSLIGIAPSDTRSIGVLDGTLYLGGVHGVLYRYSDPLAVAALTAIAVPEPSAMLLVFAGAACLAVKERRRMRVGQGHRP